MKPHTIQQEILLFANTTFSNRQLWAKDASDDCRHISPSEQMEEACWNGLLDELLPEVTERSASGKKLLLWWIRQYESFLQIELCEYPQKIEKKISINPYFFLSTISYN